MTKPLGYYVATEPEASAILDEMQEAWGTTFQSLNNCQRAWMIHRLADELQAEFYADHDLDGEVEEFMDRMDEISTSEKIGLIEALINQIKTRQ